MNAASAIGHAYSETGRNGETIRILTECLARWSYDIRQPNVSPVIISIRHTMLFSLKCALEAESLPHSDELDQELAELRRIIARLRSPNP